MASIMIIDDDPLFAELTFQRLERVGHTVAVHPGTSDALAAVRGGAFDVIVVDVHMPELAGTRLAELIREGGQGSPRVLLTSSMDSDELSELAAQHGADAWLSKSASSAELLEVVGKLSGHGS